MLRGCYFRILPAGGAVPVSFRLSPGDFPGEEGLFLIDLYNPLRIPRRPGSATFRSLLSVHYSLLSASSRGI